MRCIPVFGCDASQCTLSLIRRLQRFLLPDSSKIFLFRNTARVTQRTSPTTEVGQTQQHAASRWQTAAAVNGSEHSFSPFRNHNEWRCFCEGQNTDRPAFESRKNLHRIGNPGARIRRYKPFYGYLAPFRDNHPIRTVNWTGKPGSGPVIRSPHCHREPLPDTLRGTAMQAGMVEWQTRRS